MTSQKGQTQHTFDFYPEDGGLLRVMRYLGGAGVWVGLIGFFPCCLYVLFAADTLSWVEVSGTLVGPPEVKVEEAKWFAYEVDGQHYWGRSWVFSPGVFSEMKTKAQYERMRDDLSRYEVEPEGELTRKEALGRVVYHHPNDARRAVYYAGVSWGHLTGVLVCILLTMLGSVFYRLGVEGSSG